MLRKIVLATALVASASFATWDYFPVLESGKGTVEGGLYYDWHHDWSQAGLSVGARYSLIQNLELSLTSFGFQFWGETDCNGCANGGEGFKDLTLGGRYQVTPMVAAFLDLRLPIGRTEWDGNGTNAPGSDEFAMYFGAQFSMSIAEAPGLAFGTEAGLDWGFEHDNYERGLEIHIAGEVDYTIPNIGLTPYLGIKFKLQQTEDEEEGADGKDYGKDDAGDSQFNLWLGASYAISQQLSVKGQLIFRSGDMDGDASGIYVGCDFNF